MAEFDNIFDHGVDLKNRRIYFGALLESYDENGSDFTWRSCEWAIRAIHVMEQAGPNKPIELHMSSPGGDPYEMRRLCDVILSCACQIKFFGGGKIMSAATWIMAVCDERYLYPGTRVLIHDSPSGGFAETPEKLSDRYIDTDEEKRLQEELNQLYADNSRMPKDFWDEIVKRDTYLSAEETIMLGLADKLIEPKKRGNLRKVRIAQLKKEVDKKALTKLVKGLYKRTYNGNHHKVEVHFPAEEFDPKLKVDNTPQTLSPNQVLPVEALVLQDSSLEPKPQVATAPQDHRSST